MSAIEKAENSDKYLEICRNSPINARARARCSYTLWNDQSLAKTAKSFLDDIEGVEVAIMNPSAEGGMPHTRAPALICLPAYFPESKLKETLDHELIHISQRRQPSLWAKRAEMDGWLAVADSTIPDEWRNRCRLNPDTVAARFFAWQGRHVPLPLFVREDKPDLRDIVVRWYDIKEGIVKSAIPSSFTRKYGALDNNALEHPYELWAYDGSSK